MLCFLQFILQIGANYNGCDTICSLFSDLRAILINFIRTVFPSLRSNHICNSYAKYPFPVSLNDKLILKIVDAICNIINVYRHNIERQFNAFG